MHLLIALALITALPLISGEFEARNLTDVAHAHSACQLERKPPDELFEKFVHLEFPEHESTACYVECLLRKLDMYSDEKGFLWENIVKQIAGGNPDHEQTTRVSLQKCFSDRPIPASETCPWVLTNFQCFMAKNGQAVFDSFSV